MAALCGQKLFAAMLKVGAEPVSADGRFPTSVISNGWNHLACAWISFFCMGLFTWPYNEMLVESSTDLADDSCSIWPLMMSEDLIVSNWKGLAEPQSLNISGWSIHPVKEPSREHC